MIFVDTNVFVYAVGREHPLRSQARSFFRHALESRTPLVASAEVLQELLHLYLPVDRIRTLDAALVLAGSTLREVWAVEREDVGLARDLHTSHRGLGARDLLHLACCRRRGVGEVKTFDRGLQAAFQR